MAPDRPGLDLIRRHAAGVQQLAPHHLLLESSLAERLAEMPYTKRR